VPRKVYYDCWRRREEKKHYDGHRRRDFIRVEQLYPMHKTSARLLSVYPTAAGVGVGCKGLVCLLGSCLFFLFLWGFGGGGCGGGALGVWFLVFFCFFLGGVFFFFLGGLWGGGGGGKRGNRGAGVHETVSCRSCCGELYLSA